ncbi:hypothetical protein SEA_OTTAWA_30 [Arthrobacter phage Ottawa]|nr:hypothetical protein SEA_KHARCHO_30 [Arthrobacter phage Kharcho]WIC89262.1 hypothetical protein SEA_OTTAWA_30 [Arthrobacter phage Ottawa]
MSNTTFTAVHTLHIGRGLAVHLNATVDGVLVNFPECGTKRNPRSRYTFFEGDGTTEVTCEKCRAKMAAAAELEAQTEREDAMAAEEAMTPIAPVTIAEERSTDLMFALAGRETPAAAPAFAKGDVVNSKDGNQYVVRRVNANGTIRLVAANGSKVNRKAETLTKA